MSKKEDDLLFEVDDFKVYRNRSYVVKNKPDMDAPKAFRDHNTSKVLGIEDSFQMPYVVSDKGSGRGIWDTGFYENSPCYGHLDASTRKTKVAALRKNVLEPYRMYIPDDSVTMEQTGNFWDEYNVKVSSGEIFETSNPEAVLSLYTALRARKVTPKGKEGEPEYLNSYYVIVDMQQNTKASEEKTDNEFEAISTFAELLSTDKNKMRALLQWLGLNVSESISDSTAKDMFKQKVISNNSKVSEFIRISTEASTAEGYDKFQLYQKLKKQLEKAGTKVTKVNGKIYFEAEELGEDLKSAAGNVAEKKLFADIKKQILLSD